MARSNLAAKAAALGLKPEGSDNVNKTLAELISSREGEFWEAFPLLLANAAGTGKFSFSETEACLPEEEKKFLKLLVMLSLGLYAVLKLKAPWKARLSADMPARLVENFRQKIESGDGFDVGGIEIRPEKLRETFLSGYSEPEGQDRLESAIAAIFTPRQRELLLKKVRRAPLTKTEREYYSRVIKKKVVALASEELHSLARRALG